MLIYRFRNCLLNTIERSVIKGDQYVELTTKTFDVLTSPDRERRQHRHKRRTLGAVWNGNFVEESNLPVHISKLRRSYGETRRERYIETIKELVTGFIAPVEEAKADVWAEISKR
jgi:DNA-binding winged helix-turn-helix (wHTH) protein